MKETVGRAVITEIRKNGDQVVTVYPCEKYPEGKTVILSGCDRAENVTRGDTGNIVFISSSGYGGFFLFEKDGRKAGLPGVNSYSHWIRI